MLLSVWVAHAEFFDITKTKIVFDAVFNYVEDWKPDAQPTSIIVNGSNGQVESISFLFFSHSTGFFSFSKNAMLGVKVNLQEPTKLEIEKFSDNKEYKPIVVFQERNVASPIKVFEDAGIILNTYANKYPDNEFSAIIKGERLGYENKMLWYFSVQRISSEQRKYPLTFFINSESLDICCINSSDTGIKNSVSELLKPYEKDNGTFNLNRTVYE